MIRKLTTPLSREDVLSLRAGDQVLLSGVVYTARDAAFAPGGSHGAWGSAPLAPGGTGDLLCWPYAYPCRARHWFHWPYHIHPHGCLYPKAPGKGLRG